MKQADKFSPSEKRVIEQLLQGKSNKQIAQALGISERTVEFHLGRIYEKLGVTSRAAAILELGKAAKQPLSDLPEEPTVDIGKKNDYSGAKKWNQRSLAMYTTLLLLLAVVFILFYSQRADPTWPVEKEAEFPDEFTVGQDLDRSNASGTKVHGQFGVEDAPPWTAKAGFVKYYNIEIRRSGPLYLQLRYSKYSKSSVPILVYIDDEQNPRKSFYPDDQGDWNNFALTEWLPLGNIEKGKHSIKFSTNGQQYGVADLDRFTLTTEPPP